MIAPNSEEDDSRYPFDLSRCVVADVETYPNRWCVGFHGLSLDGEIRTQIVDGDRAKLARTLDTLAEHGRILITYNGDHFDVPVIRAILGSFDPYSVGQSIITEGRLPAQLSRLPKLPCD